MFPLRDINPTRIFPALTLLVVVANVLVFFAAQPFDEVETQEFFYQNAAIACELTTGEPLDVEEIQRDVCLEGGAERAVFPDKNVWVAAVVSMFLHAGFFHLFFNMWSLWIFGNNVEEAFGRAGFVLLYVGAGIVATAGFVLLNPDSTIPLVGASGAIAGIMGAYLVLFPTHRIVTIVFLYVVAVPAMLFLGVWFATQFLFVTEDTNIAWEAHVFGFVFGAAIALPLRRPLLRRTAEIQLDSPADPFRSVR